MKPVTHRISPFLILVLFLLSPLTGSAQELDEQACRALADLGITDTNLLSAIVVPAGEDLPAYCRVLGYVRTAINFEIRLPISDWNGKFYMAGCGALCGRLNIRDTNNALSRNYAVSSSDAGHWGTSIWDGKWAFNNPTAELDWAYRAGHETARVTKEIIESYYGGAPDKSYFQSCSNGGRMANMEAWRYPEDFDGIISGAPAINMTGITLFGAWLRQANTDAGGKPIITVEDLPLIAEVVKSSCDEQDGLIDGLIDDPRSCTFDPEILQCGTTSEENCLSQEQVSTLKKWYQPPVDSRGKKLFAEGLPLGSEPFWGLWIIGRASDNLGRLPVMAEQLLRYAMFQEDPGEGYSIMEFDFDNDSPKLERVASVINSDNPDLEAFRKNGGKMLMWHGWADTIVPPITTTQYYEAIEKKVGSSEATQDFLRLFMVPGMDHCGIQDGPGIRGNGFDTLTALEKWVEEDEAPDHLKTTKMGEGGEVLWTRPVCSYPQIAKYKGQGDVNVASSFECVDP